MVHSVSGWTRGMQVKLWDPLRARAIPECLRGVFTTRRYTNQRLPYLILQTMLHCHIHHPLEPIQSMLWTVCQQTVTSRVMQPVVRPVSISQNGRIRAIATADRRGNRRLVLRPQIFKSDKSCDPIIVRSSVTGPWLITVIYYSQTRNKQNPVAD